MSFDSVPVGTLIGNGMALLAFSAAIQLIATAIVLLASIMVDVIVRRRGATEH